MKFICFPILSVLIGSAAIASAAVVSGVVVNNKTRQPVVGAEVRLVPKSSNGVILGALSGSGGRFSFRDVAEGEYVLEAKSPASYGFRVRPARRIAFRAGDSLAELVIELGPMALIAGRVTYEDGAPAAGITVSAVWGE
jgi:hypothetical protein